MEPIILICERSESFKLNCNKNKTGVLLLCKHYQFVSRWIFETNSQVQPGGNSRCRLLTFPDLFSLLGSVLPLFLDDGQPGQVRLGLISLPLAMELVVALL